MLFESYFEKMKLKFSYFGICPILGGRIRTEVFSDIDPATKTNQHFLIL